jgi:hypothetical protein
MVPAKGLMRLPVVKLPLPASNKDAPCSLNVSKHYLLHRVACLPANDSQTPTRAAAVAVMVTNQHGLQAARLPA